MLHALTVLAAAESGGHEKSKAAFYIFGALLAVWAVVLTAIGMSRAGFPATASAKRGVLLITAVFVLAAMASAIITA
jgi:hypothetical protein